MVESTCKLVLEDYGETAPKNANLGQLYKQVAGVLKLDPAAVEGDNEASRAARQVLQGLVSVAAGMGELRTRIGRGHGRAQASPARQRHAELTTSCAATLTLFLLDTWHARRSEGPEERVTTSRPNGWTEGTVGRRDALSASLPAHKSS